MIGVINSWNVFGKRGAPHQPGLSRGSPSRRSMIFTGSVPSIRGTLLYTLGAYACV